jgi:SAM-dependent methyltransferase
MDTRSISTAYNLVAEEYAQKFLDELERKNMDKVVLDWFATQIPNNEVVLEIGTGPGEVSGYLDNLGIKCIGTDISPVMIENAKRNFPYIMFEVQDFFDITYPENTFYGVVGFYAIVNYHPDDLLPIFKNIKRVLKENGLFLFTFHVFEGERKTYVEKFLEKEGSKLTFYYYEVDEIKNIVENLGFEIVDIIIRYPYEGFEFPSKRSYFILRNSQSF